MSEPEPTSLTQGQSTEVTCENISAEDLRAIETAYRQLESLTFASRLTGMLGRRIESAGILIPDKLRRLAGRATNRALEAAMKTALHSLRDGGLPASRTIHRVSATATGAVGGAFGLASLPIELPISTILLLRAIADIARHEGEDLSHPETALACMQVFALGGHSPEDDFVDASYFAVRALLARTISDAARYVGSTAAINETAPVLMRFMTQIAARFGLVVTQKFAAQAIPIIGAAGGAMVNYAFMEHFQALAQGHFTIRRLERKYGQPAVQIAYINIQHAVVNR
jgi:hypothetical protein